MITIEEEEAEIRKIQRAITRKKAKWTAGKTSISRLSPDEFKRLCGLLIRPIPEEERVKPVIIRETPSKFDWRDKDGGDWTTRIKSQGACGSCWAFGSIAALEAQHNIQSGIPDTNRDLAEQYMLSCSAGSCSGWYISNTMNWLKIPLWKPDIAEAGAPDEACFPYQANDTIPCDNACHDHLNRLAYLRDWHYVSSDGEAIKNFILVAPVPAGMAVYDDFRTYSGGVYEHVWGNLLGYHLIAIVGWDNDNSCWICKNSWSTGWGESGWFRIKYNACEINNMITQYNRVGAGFGNIQCISEPPGAEIFLNGASLGKNTPHTIENIATYPFEIKYALNGYEDCVKHIDALANETIDCYCKLTPKAPDMAISADDIAIIPETPSEMDTISITATIRNIGVNDASSAKVSFYDGTPAEGALISEAIVTDINAGISKTVSADWVPEKKPGIHNIYVLISDTIPPEHNIDNNEAIKSIVIKVVYGLCVIPRVITKKPTPRTEQNVMFPRVGCILKRRIGL